MFRTRRSLFFKKMQIVRGCDVKRNVLVYMVYSRPHHRGLAEELDLVGADHAVGHGRRCAEMRRLGDRLAFSRRSRRYLRLLPSLL